MWKQYRLDSQYFNEAEPPKSSFSNRPASLRPRYKIKNMCLPHTLAPLKLSKHSEGTDMGLD